MKLLTDELIKQFAKTGNQDGNSNPLVIAKFFNPCGASTWYATEYDPVDKVFFGYVSLFGDHNDEWGSFSLDELEGLKLPFGLGIERDKHCGIKPIKDFDIPTLKK